MTSGFTAKHARLSALALWLGVFVLALAVRLVSVSALLPLVYQPDEPTNEKVILRVAHEPTSSPAFFNYPSLMFYVQAAVARGYELSTGETLKPVIMASSANARTDFPGYWTAARSTTAVFGSGVAVLAALIASLLTRSRWGGAWAGLWVALSPELVDQSRLISPDTFAAFFATAAVLAAVVIAQGGGWLAFAVGGVMVGLAAGSKYNAALVAIAIVVAQLGRDPRRGLLDWRLYLAGGCSLLAFLLSTPFALLDSAQFLEALSAEAAHYSTGHAGAEGSSLVANLRALWDSEGFRLLGLLPLALIKDRGAWRILAALASFVVGYFLLLSSFEVHFSRNLLPLLPSLLVLCVVGFAAALRARPVAARHAPFAAGALALLLCIVPSLSIAATVKDRRFDWRAESSQWIAEHLPARSRVALEGYGPFVDPRRFRVKNIRVYADLPERDLALRGFDYAVLSDVRARFYVDRKSYAAQIARYESLLHGFCKLAEFRPAPLDPKQPPPAVDAPVTILDLHCTPAATP